MAKRIDKMTKQYIFDEIDRRGFTLIDDVVEVIKPLGLYDPIVSETQWYKDKARRLLATRRNEAGSRTVFAVDNGDGKFIDVRTASSLSDLNGVIRQLTNKRDGIDVSLKEAAWQKAQLEGQTTLFAAVGGRR